MQQMQEMGDFGTITNSRYLYSASPLIEHIYIDAFPPHRQDQIRFATLHEVAARPEVLWDAKQRFAPQFSTEVDEHGDRIGNVYIDICTDSHNGADAAYAQRLQNSIDEKDQVVYSKRKLQMQEDAAYAQSLQLIAHGDNSKKTRTSKLADNEKAHTNKMALSEIEIAGALGSLGESSPDSQQMSSVNTRENLQMRLDLVTPLSVIEAHQTTVKTTTSPSNSISWKSWKKLSMDNHTSLINIHRPTSLSMDRHQKGHQLKILVRTLIDSPHLIKQRLSLPDQTSAKNGK
jgi:hypothetical protein